MPCRPPAFGVVLAGLALAVAAPVHAGEDADAGPAFSEGDLLTGQQIQLLRPYLPPEFWSYRDLFFYEGMRLEIGPAHRDYSPPPEYRAATERFRGQARIGPDNSLENYTAGQPFPAEEIDCAADPDAGVKIIWNFDYRWNGDGAEADFYYSYWDRGEQLPLYYNGTSKGVLLAHRVEADFLEKGGDFYRNEYRKSASGLEVTQPFDVRGVAALSYRYKEADAPRSEAKNDDTWVYVPTLRRVRRFSAAQRTEAISGTDFTFDDLSSFSGIVPQYEWTCLGEMDLLAPMNSKVLGYPYDEQHNFGPYGLSFADDRWELRRAVKVRMIPKNPDHPYHHKDIYIDKQSMEPLYSFAYDRKEELWKIIWHNHRWSEDHPDWYHGWEGVERPRDVRVVSDIIANVQTGTGNRIEFWNAHGMPMLRGRKISGGKVRRYIDVGRLSRGR